MPSLAPTLLWFRQDLRLQDNPALQAAMATSGPVLPVYILDDEAEGRWRMGGASRWWLHHSLAALDEALRRQSSCLFLARGESGAVLRGLVQATGATAIYWNRRYEPALVARDARLKREFLAEGLDVKTFNGALLHEPHTVANKQGRPFQVFTPYWRYCLTLPVTPPIKFRGPLKTPSKYPASLELNELELLPRFPWDGGLAQTWCPGEVDSTKRLARFVARNLDHYDVGRDRPGCDGTAMLSAALHFGEISPRQIWAAVKSRSNASGVFPSSNGARVFLAEIGWREFAHSLLFHFPTTPENPHRAEFAGFPWADDPGDVMLRAWQRGLTGYPIVDAGMRQLWTTGWMHNRVRMIVGSFLVKHLRLSWTRGAAWFWDTLVDADLANNTLGWQWIAGSGADAAPYFRVFSPLLQGKKFDPDGEYVRRWVPELSWMPAEYIHAPAEAPQEVLVNAGVSLGETYPRPIVDHAIARTEALAAFETLRAADVNKATLRDERR